MKIVVDIKGKLKKNDILIYDGDNFIPANKDFILFDLQQEIARLKDYNDKLKNEINAFKEGVNDKLKDYHNILQQLTKEE